MRFKNKTNEDLSIPGIGLVKAGGIVNLPNNFHNANFEKVVEKKEIDIKKEGQVNKSK
jgi:hypothetical protein